MSPFFYFIIRFSRNRSTLDALPNRYKIHGHIVLITIIDPVYKWDFAASQQQMILSFVLLQTLHLFYSIFLMTVRWFYVYSSQLFPQEWQPRHSLLIVLPIVFFFYFSFPLSNFIVNHSGVLLLSCGLREMPPLFYAMWLILSVETIFLALPMLFFPVLVSR